MAELMDQDRRRQLECMQAELVAARSLYMDGVLGPASLHLNNAWYAMACLLALERGEALPDMDALELTPESLPNGARLARHTDLWAESYAALRQLAPTSDLDLLLERHAALQEAPRSSSRRLRALVRFQLRMAEEAFQRIFWRDARARVRRVVSRRKGLVVSVTAMVILLGGAGIFWVVRAIQARQAVGAARAGAAALPPPLTFDRYKLADLSQPVARGTDFRAPGVHRFRHGVVIDLGQPRRAPRLEVSLDNNDTYLIELFGGEPRKKVGALKVPRNPKVMGMRVEQLQVPEAAVAAGYHTVQVSFVSGDIFHGIGHFALLQ